MPTETANASNSLEDIAPYQNCGIAKLLSVTPVSQSKPSFLIQHRKYSRPVAAHGTLLFDTPHIDIVRYRLESCTQNLMAKRLCVCDR